MNFMLVDSLKSWKACLEKLQKHPETCYCFTKKNNNYTVLTTSELPKGSLLSINKVIAISRFFSNSPQDPELGLLIGRQLFIASSQKDKRFFILKGLSTLIERINNFLIGRGFVTNIQDYRSFVEHTLGLDSLDSDIKASLIATCNKEKPDLKQFDAYFKTRPASIQAIFSQLSSSDDLAFNLWLLTNKHLVLTKSSLQKKKTLEKKTQGFVGSKQLKLKQKDHLEKLKALAGLGNWSALQKHTSHPDSGFDWWMFPTTWKSNSHGEKYQLDDQAILELKQDAEFMKNYKEGVALVAKSWGWDIDQAIPLSDPQLKWVDYSIRLEKMIHSLSLFEEKEYLDSLKRFIQSKNIHLHSWALAYLK